MRITFREVISAILVVFAILLMCGFTDKYSHDVTAANCVDVTLSYVIGICVSLVILFVGLVISWAKK